MRPLACLLVAALACASDGPQIPADMPVRIFELGRFRAMPPPGGNLDPVAPLSSEDKAALAKPQGKVWDQIVDHLAERCADTYLKGGALPEGLAALFKAKPNLAREFWLAIDPRFDDPAAAVAIMEQLRAADPKRFEQFYQLAIAMAVVWDSPDAVDSSRYYPLWGVQLSQFPKRMDLMQVWNWFSDPKRQAQLRFKPTELNWPIMVHLVDLALSPEEAQWAVANCGKMAADPSPLYPQVPYDNDKLVHHPKLGDKPYVLDNLKSFGGVCVDQAHYATEIAKALGVPAIKCTGEGRYGGQGHAWTGFLTARKGRPLLEFTGRYQYDFYYTGDVFDPQTRTMTMDRSVALLYDAVSGGHPAMVKAMALARIATALMRDEPALAGKVAEQAIKTNAYAADAWQVYFHVAAKGETDRKQAIRHANQVVKDLAEHPDVTIACLDDILALFPPEKIDDRVAIYEAAYGLYKQAKRPDLQIRLRMAETRELAGAKREIDALAKALETVQANSAEGTLILPLVQQVVEQSLRFKTTVKGFQIQVVREGLRKAATDFPKSRGTAASPAWSEFQDLQAKLGS